METKSLTLTVREIYDLARAAGFIMQPFADEGDAEIEYTIFENAEGVTVKDDDGTPHTYAHGAYLDEYPEEGTFPLGEKLSS